jgi:hypothetical protein
MAARQLKDIIGKPMRIEDHNDYRKEIYRLIKPNMSKRELERYDQLFPFIEHYFSREEINQIIFLRLQLGMAQLGLGDDMDIDDVDMGGGRRKKHKRYRKKSKKSRKHSRRLRK